MKRLKKFISRKFSRNWHKSIFVRTFLVSWILIILTLLIFIMGTLPYEQKIIEDRMKSEANDIAGSIGQVTATAIINNDYGFTVDHCLNVIRQSNSILYIIITRKDGFSLVHRKSGWRSETLKDNLNLPQGKEPQSSFVFSKMENQEVYHFSAPFNYSGIDWGRINVGLSLKVYNENVAHLYIRTIVLALLCIIVGLFVSVFFAKKLTDPIRQLDNVALQIAGGDLKARVDIRAENEIGRLAHSFNRMTQSLQFSQDNLEKKVEERTAELAETNEILHVEIKERVAAETALKQYNLRLEALDKIYTGIISAKSVDDIVTETIQHQKKLFPNADCAAVILSESILDEAVIFSLNFNNRDSVQVNKEVLSRKKQDAPPENVQPETDYIIAGEEYCILKQHLFALDIKSTLSSPLIIEGKTIGVLNIISGEENAFNREQKEILNIVGNQLAVAVFQAQLQAQIKKHANSLQNSLSEKEVLLKEIHHRVKNNLQVISSLLYLNSKKIDDKKTLDMFKDSQNRVKSIALVHERLYQSNDLARIDFKDYIKKLTYDLFRSYAVNSSVINLVINVEDVNIDIDKAVPCGLIINELISNALKYAFPNYESENKHGQITIEFCQNEAKQLLLRVADNGIGIPEDTQEKKKNSLGLQLVDTLVKQLEGTVEINSNPGTEFRIRFEG